MTVHFNEKKNAISAAKARKSDLTKMMNFAVSLLFLIHMNLFCMFVYTYMHILYWCVSMSDERQRSQRQILQKESVHRAADDIH